MTVAHVHCDIEQLLIGWIPTVVPARVLTETTATLVKDITDNDGVIQVVRTGGGNGAPGFDLPTVAVDVFGLTRPAAKAMAYTLNAALLYELPGFFNPYGTVLTAKTLSGPFDLYYANPNVRRFTATYQFTVHSRTD